MVQWGGPQLPPRPLILQATCYRLAFQSETLPLSNVPPEHPELEGTPPCQRGCRHRLSLDSNSRYQARRPREAEPGRLRCRIAAPSGLLMGLAEPPRLRPGQQTCRGETASAPASATWPPWPGLLESSGAPERRSSVALGLIVSESQQGEVAKAGQERIRRSSAGWGSTSCLPVPSLGQASPGGPHRVCPLRAETDKMPKELVTK